MSFKLTIRKKAEKDIESAFDWYFEKSVKSAENFLSEIDHYINFINQHPFSFEVKYKNVRFIELKKYPICIHYIIHEKAKKIVIIAILSSKQNPLKWG